MATLVKAQNAFEWTNSQLKKPKGESFKAASDPKAQSEQLPKLEELATTLQTLKSLGVTVSVEQGTFAFGPAREERMRTLVQTACKVFDSVRRTIVHILVLVIFAAVAMEVVSHLHVQVIVSAKAVEDKSTNLGRAQACFGGSAPSGMR